MERLGRPKGDVTERHVLSILLPVILRLIFISAGTQNHCLKTWFGEWRKSCLKEI